MYADCAVTLYGERMPMRYKSGGAKEEEKKKEATYHHFIMLCKELKARDPKRGTKCIPVGNSKVSIECLPYVYLKVLAVEPVQYRTMGYLLLQELSTLR